MAKDFQILRLSIRSNGFLISRNFIAESGHFFLLIFWRSSLAKVSDRNSFRANQNYFDSFRSFYPSQCESSRTNPKNVLYLICWKMVKNRSDLIRFNPRQQSKWIRNQVFNPNISEVGMIRINSDWKFGLDQSENGYIRIENLVRIHLDCCLGLNRIRSDRFFTIFHQTRFKTFFGLVQNDSHWLGYRYRNESE